MKDTLCEEDFKDFEKHNTVDPYQDKVVFEAGWAYGFSRINTISNIDEKKIYLVTGSSGAYDDIVEWTVGWSFSKEIAESIMEKCNKETYEFYLLTEAEKKNVKNKILSDPYFYNDDVYNNTEYYVKEVNRLG